MLAGISLTIELRETELLDKRNGDSVVKWISIVEWRMKVVIGHWHYELRERSFDPQDEWTNI